MGWRYLEFTIWLYDADIVRQLNQQIENATGLFPLVGVPNLSSTTRGVLRAPDAAATEFADYVDAPPFPIFEVGDPIVPTAGGYITSPWFVPGNGFPRDVDSFQKSSGWWIFGDTKSFYWGGSVKLAPSAAGAPAVDEGEEPVERENVRFGFATRHFIEAMDQPI